MKRKRIPLPTHPLTTFFQPAAESVTTSLGDASITSYRGTVRHFLTYLGAQYSEVHSLDQLRRDPHILGWPRVHGELPNWPECGGLSGVDTIAGMRDFVVLFVHLIVTMARLARPGGLRSVVAESVLVRHQLLVLNRGRKRAPNLRATDRIIAGLCTLFMRPARVVRSAIVLKSSTLLHLHSVLRQRKYRMLFSPGRRRRPGPKGPDKDLIEAAVAMKRRNPGWGCPRIAQQIALAFGVGAR